MNTNYFFKKCNHPLRRVFSRSIWLMSLGILLSVSNVCTAYAESFTQPSLEVTGVVTDAVGALPGVSIVVKGTTNGTVTDANGNFSIKVSDANAVLVFKFIGYIPQEVTVGTSRSLRIVMTEALQTLDEVVVTGYGGTQKRSKLTNSITSVKSESLEVGVYSNPAQALSGAVAGLRVIQSSGNPNAIPTIVLRGGTNLNGSGAPLIMIDGQFRYDMRDINPEDIESMEVLKDAGATALYGARASNGVILITTKNGKSGRSEINVSAKVGLNYLNTRYEPLSAQDYIYWLRNGVKNCAQIWQDQNGNWRGYWDMSSLTQAQPYGTGNLYWDPNNPSVPLDGNRDSRALWSPMILNESNRFLLNEGWQTMTDPIFGDEIIFKEFDYLKAGFNSPTVTQDYNINFSGGNDKGHYYAGLGYYYAEGLPLETFYNRLNGIFNGDYQVKPWLTSYSNLNFSTAKYKNPRVGDDQLFYRYLTAPPTLRGTNPDGVPLIGRGGNDANPNAYLNIFIRDLNRTYFSLGQSFKFDIMKGLYVKASALVTYEENFNENFNKDYLNSVNNWNRTRSSSAAFEREIRQTYNIIANYDVAIAEKHSLNILAGAEGYEFYVKGFNASGSGAPTDDFRDLELTSTDENRRAIDSWHARNRMLSFMGRINYDYDSKYLLSVTFREDGFSGLIDNRWGFFPGISAGWVFSREDFMQHVSDWVSFAKLRTSYGVNGNLTGISDYGLQGIYGITRYDAGVGYSLTTIPNPGLRWERSNTFEAGLDVGLFENMINANVTFYDRNTVDKFANIPLPASSGISSIGSNNGVFNNRGIEIELGYKLLGSDDWKWNINANITWYRNKVVKLPDNGLERNRQGAIQVYSGNGDELIWVGGYQEGCRPGDIYGYIAEGIFKTDEEVQRIAGDRLDISVGDDGIATPLYGPNLWNQLTDAEKARGLPIQAGDVNWRDVNGDGEINNYDKVYLGNRDPKWFGGLTNTLSWKQLTLFARLDYALGHTQTDWATKWIMGCKQGTFNSIQETKNTWTPDNIHAKYPKFYWADQEGKRNYDRVNNMFAYRADYLCFRDLSLSYDIPKKWVGTMGMTKLQLSVTGQNLAYLSKSKQFTPEVGGEELRSGYSLPRTVIFGLSLTF